MSKSKATADQTACKKRQECCLEMSDVISNLMDDINNATEEIRYLQEYISYKNLGEEFVYFRKNAHEEYDEDLPFPRLTLQQ